MQFRRTCRSACIWESYGVVWLCCEMRLCRHGRAVACASGGWGGSFDCRATATSKRSYARGGATATAWIIRNATMYDTTLHAVASASSLSSASPPAGGCCSNSGGDSGATRTAPRMHTRCATLPAWLAHYAGLSFDHSSVGSCPFLPPCGSFGWRIPLRWRALVTPTTCAFGEGGAIGKRPSTRCMVCAHSPRQLGPTVHSLCYSPDVAPFVASALHAVTSYSLCVLALAAMLSAT